MARRDYNADMNASEFENAYLGKFNIEGWQKDLLERSELMCRYRFGVYVEKQRSMMWQTQLMYLRACWEMGMETCMLSGDVESIHPRLHIVYDEFQPIKQYHYHRG